MGIKDNWSTIDIDKLKLEFSFTTKSCSFTLHVKDGSEELSDPVTRFIGSNLDLYLKNLL